MSIKEHLSQSTQSENEMVLELRLRDNHTLTEGQGGTAFLAREQHLQRPGGLKVYQVFCNGDVVPGNGEGGS